MSSLKRARWVIAGLLALLSVIAIVATASEDTGEDSYVPHIASDIRGPGFVLGSSGLGGLMILRSAGIILPKPWRVYVDRLEFSFVTMLWILWTSATMAFSASTISKTICIDHSPTSVPQCSGLTFDLILLHGLSLAAFAYLVVVLSTALSPGYLTSHSTSLEGVDAADSNGVGGEVGSVFVMWDLAIGDSPKTNAGDVESDIREGYGTASRAIPDVERTVVEQDQVQSTDRFAKGRVGMYSALLSTSLAVIFSISAVSTGGFPGLMAMLVLMVAILSVVFAISFLYIHRLHKRTNGSTRRYRAVELGTILTLFLLWPMAATLYTINPSAQSQPCKSTREPPSMTLLGVGHDDDSDSLDNWFSICNLTLLTLSLSWFCGWVALARAVSLVFAMPDSKSDLPSITVPILGQSRGLPGTGGEAQPLLSPVTPRESRTGRNAETSGSGVERPQVKYGRLVAGEAFELGDDED